MLVVVRAAGAAATSGVLGVLADDPERLARFKREAQVLASLNHPHIGAIYGVADVGAANTGG